MKYLLLPILLLIFIGLFSSCDKERLQVEYKYEVSGTSGDYSVTLENTDNETQQWNSVGTGWQYTWNQSGSRWLYVSAQNNSSEGNVTVKIIKAGKVVAENTSYGGYTIATTSGEF